MALQQRYQRLPQLALAHIVHAAASPPVPAGRRIHSAPPFRGADRSAPRRTAPPPRTATPQVDQYYYGANNTIQHSNVNSIISAMILGLVEDPNRRFIYVEQAFFQRCVLAVVAVGYLSVGMDPPRIGAACAGSRP